MRVSLFFSICIFCIPNLSSAGVKDEIDRIYGSSSYSSKHIKQQVDTLGEDKVKGFWLSDSIIELSNQIIPFSNSFPLCFERLSFHLPQVRADTPYQILTHWLQSQDLLKRLEHLYHSTRFNNILDLLILLTPRFNSQFGQPLAFSFLDYWLNQVAMETVEVTQLNQLASNNFYCAQQVGLQVFFNQQNATVLVNFWSSNYHFLTQLNSPSEAIIQALVVSLPNVTPSHCPQIMQWVQANVNEHFTLGELLQHIKSWP